MRTLALFLAAFSAPAATTVYQASLDNLTIVHGAADQCVALVEASGVNAVIVAGGDNGFNHLFVQPEIERIADLRGRTLVADVANTGWSFVLSCLVISLTRRSRSGAAPGRLIAVVRWKRSGLQRSEVSGAGFG